MFQKNTSRFVYGLVVHGLFVYGRKVGILPLCANARH